ncbi:probable F-box protein At1g53815 [Papaver somniferum]|uniref:probable F-box protein At1g53815 n=1 Tax=Papaver somniferum TaxID=3469 RepID=UPI000E6FEEE8|nr:probable F-box protein At1g53815 [Papaver somniferum]
MQHSILNSFIAFFNGGKRSFQLKIDLGEEKEEEQQNGMERGAVGCLPEELVIESILTRLPARTLGACCCVSKLWYNSILKDSRFSVFHYIQNKNKLFLVFNILNLLRGGIESNYWFSLLEREKVVIRLISGQNNPRRIYELVGFCNGLPCIKLVGKPTDTCGYITILNPIRGDSLVLSYILMVSYIHLCHGFGYDSLSQVYKAVIIFASKANDEFLCMVITLGTMSWRKIITSILDISPPPGSSPFPSRMITRVSRTLYRQATFCGGDLYWRTKNKVANNDDEIEMLLSLDLHNEKIRFIRLPTGCTPTHEGQYLIIDHLLEFKGYPCSARYERMPNSIYHCGHRCNYQTGVC